MAVFARGSRRSGTGCPGASSRGAAPPCPAGWIRRDLLAKDPALAATRKQAEWSEKLTVGDATVRVFFPPEKKPGRTSVDPIVDAVQNARQSVIFGLFSSTDEALREACFQAGDQRAGREFATRQVAVGELARFRNEWTSRNLGRSGG
jgi:hypothetical protein